jgi:hypothetical protein
MEDTTPKSTLQFPLVKDLREALPQGPEDSGTYLCEECSVIHFDERKLGGYEGLSESGQPILQFDAKDVNKQLALNYSHEDVLPDLPGLQNSAEAGCGFCKVLRDAVMELELPLPDTIEIKLSYVWSGITRGEEPVDQCSLYGLVAKITPLVNDTMEVVTTRLFFVAELGSGMNMSYWLMLGS